MPMNLGLNDKAWRLAEFMSTAAQAQALKIAASQLSNGARVLDCGIKAVGGLQAGLAMARVCLAGQAEISLMPGDVAGIACPTVQVFSDVPVQACMASQYAGWEIYENADNPEKRKFFAMGSGPMRAIYGKEELFDHIDGREKAGCAVGVLESRKLPSEAVVAYLSSCLSIPPAKIALLAAPAASIAGNLQVVARSLETALHKLHELKFDLNLIVSGIGSAPLPPVAADELIAVGRTNDAILYGGRVVLWLRCEDELIAEFGPKVPASASPDYGAPFASLFQRAGGDFYKIDRLLFSPAEVVLCNLKSGHAFTYGKTRPDVLQQSFFGA